MRVSRQLSNNRLCEEYVSQISHKPNLNSTILGETCHIECIVLFALYLEDLSFVLLYVFIIYVETTMNIYICSTI